MTTKNAKIDEAKIKELCKETVQKLHTDSDIDTLTMIKKAFKRTVPFYLRNYVAAYFIDQILKGNALRPNYSPSQRANNFSRGAKDYNPQRERQSNSRYTSSSYSKNSESDTQSFSRDSSFSTKSEYSQSFEAGGAKRSGTIASPRPPFTPFIPAKLDNPKSIFLNVGKNRHIFPQDLLALLEEVALIPKERVGSIKIMSNYTFVDLSEEDVQKAINALNDYDYKHKKLVVNNARAKGDYSQTVDSPKATSSTAQSVSAESPLAQDGEK